MYRFIFILAICIVFNAVSPLGYANQDNGLSGLVEKTANSILDYFNDKHNSKVAVVKFENAAGVSDLTAQRFYQLLVSKLESSPNLSFTDLMINFQQNRGEFNLNRTQTLNHLVYLKLIRNRTRIGAGISIFSLSLDKIVYIKYFEEFFSEQEEDIFNVVNFGFADQGFAKIIEMEVTPGLLDIKSFPDQMGELRVLFYYPREIDAYKLNGSQLHKIFSYPLQWEKPYYPVLESEGKLCVFTQGNRVYITAGSNFSPRAKVLAFNEGEPGGLSDVGTVDCVPFRRIELNNREYLAGGQYDLGKNFFQAQLLLLPFQFTDGQLSIEKYLVKEIPAFYSLDFSITSGDGGGNLLNSLHLLDRDYKYRFLADNFQELTVEEGERGAALCCLGDRWLAVSDFSSGSDQLYFYDVEKGSRRLVFQNKINGEIIFISDGLWKAAPGFWVYIKQPLPNAAVSQYKLHFWSKKSE